jgi:competence protein ComEA
MPRLIAKPWYAVAVMLILAAALCASMTMLIRQSINYSTVATQQATNATAPSSSTSVDEEGAHSHSGESKDVVANESQSLQNSTNPNEAASPPLASSGTSSVAISGLVNLNTATLQELDTIPGVGPVTAQRILDHRRRIGRFTSIDQLLDISGIGPKTLEKIRPQVSVS